MQRVQTLLQKLTDLAHKKKEAGLIDIDLMMDYTRVIYADLTEMRSRVVFTNELPPTPVKNLPVQQPVITEVKQQPIEVAPVINTEDIISVPEVEKQEAEFIVHEQPQLKLEITPDAFASPVSPRPSVQTVIGINDSYLYTTELFNNNKAMFDNTLKQLNGFDDYIHAQEWIQTNYTWDVESETVQSFLNTLIAYYKNR